MAFCLKPRCGAFRIEGSWWCQCWQIKQGGFWVRQCKGQLWPWLSLPNLSTAFPFAPNPLLNFKECPGLLLLQARWFRSVSARRLLKFYSWIFFNSNVWKAKRYDSLPNSDLFFLLSSASKPAIYSLLPGSQLHLWTCQKSSVYHLITCS